MKADYSGIYPLQTAPKKMRNAQKSDEVGDKISRPLRQPVDRMAQSASRGLPIPVEVTPKGSSPHKTQSLAACLNRNETTTGAGDIASKRYGFRSSSTAQGII